MIATQGQKADAIELANMKIAEGEGYFNQGDIDSAVATFQHVLDLNADDVRANSNLGVVFWQTGDHENALKYLNRAHATDPDDKVTLTNLAEVYSTLGQGQEAQRLYADYLTRHPGDDDISRVMNECGLEADAAGARTGVSLSDQLSEHAEALLDQGKTDEALAIFSAVLALSVGQVAVHRRMGELYRSSGQRARAIEHLMEVFRMDALDKATVLTLCELLCESGLSEAAIHTCSTYIALKPEDCEVAEQLEKCWELDAAQKAAAANRDNKKEETSTASAGVGGAIIERVPVMNSVLNALSELGVEIQAILDIGVLHGTPPLMQKFPNLKHYLFEPIDDHFDVIRENYKSLDYQLFHVALSESDGQAWQNSFCIDGSGRITHSHISDKPLDSKDDPRLIKSQQVPMARLDTMMADLNVPAPCLLKIDVDGHEIPILEGARETLKNASVVVIEATARSFLDRANFLSKQGFALFDIVDFAYYSGVLHQVDIIFVRKEIIDANERMRPMSKPPFRPSHWYQVSANCFSK